MEVRSSRQLVLLPAAGSDWRLDEHTREVGRRGVAAARAILRLVSDPDPGPDGGGGGDGGGLGASARPDRPDGGRSDRAGSASRTASRKPAA